MAVYRKHLSEPWFTLVWQGAKEVEGRLFTGDFAEMAVGDTIEFYNQAQAVAVRVTYTRKYATFDEYLCAEGLARGHVVAVTNGGADAVDNLRVVCRTCNRSMGAMDMHEFVRQLGAARPGGDASAGDAGPEPGGGALHLDD